MTTGITLLLAGIVIGLLLGIPAGYAALKSAIAKSGYFIFRRKDGKFLLIDVSREIEDMEQTDDR